MPLHPFLLSQYILKQNHISIVVYAHFCLYDKRLSCSVCPHIYAHIYVSIKHYRTIQISVWKQILNRMDALSWQIYCYVVSFRKLYLNFVYILRKKCISIVVIWPNFIQSRRTILSQRDLGLSALLRATVLMAPCGTWTTNLMVISPELKSLQHTI